MNAICLVIDRLHAGYVGAFGNAWIETPAIDRLACEAITFDQALCGCPRTDAFYEAVWRGRHWLAGRPDAGPTLAELLGGAGVATTLMTDEAAVADHPAAGPFDATIELDPPELIQTARDVGATHLASCFARLIDWLDAAKGPFCLWGHLSSMAHCWDAPYAFRARYAEEDDPVPPEAADVPDVRLDEDYDPDELLGIMQSYAGQVTLLDTCVGALLEYLRESPVGRDTLLVLLSSRGFPLGEHRQVGTGGKSLYNELVQTPMMIRFPDGRAAARRSQAIVTPADLRPTLAQWWSIVLDEPARCGASLMPLVEGRSESLRDRVVLGSPDAERAIRTPAWYLRLSDTAELFVKPDDRWEVSDVADRCHEVVERLRDVAATYEEHVDAGRLDALEPLDEILLDGPE